MFFAVCVYKIRGTVADPRVRCTISGLPSKQLPIAAPYSFLSSEIDGYPMSPYLWCIFPVLVAVMSSATFDLSHPDDKVLSDPPAPVSMPHSLSVFEINMSCFCYNMDKREKLNDCSHMDI